MSLISVNKLTFSYDTSYDNIFENTSFQIDTDWKLGLIGRNGKGKTTLLHLLNGDFEYKGEIVSSVKFDIFPFNIKNISSDTHIVVEEIYPNYEYWKLIREMNLIDLSEELLYRPFNSLSFGEQTKIMLATLFLKENHFLLIDEPTNHLDINGRLVVSNYLNKKSGFILISHDRKFLDNCINHILSINRANIEVQKGNFTSWQQNKTYQDEYELGENDEKI